MRAGPGGEVIVRGLRDLRRLRARAGVVEAVLAQAARGLSADAIVGALGEGEARAAVEELRAAFVLVERRAPEEEAPTARRTLGVAGSGELARQVTELALAQGWTVKRLDAGPASSAAPGWRSLLPGGTNGSSLQWPSAALAACDAVVGAMEAGVWSDLLTLHDACLGAGVTVVPVTVDPAGVTVGPRVVGGVTACLGCTLGARLGHGASSLVAGALASLSLGTLGTADRGLAGRAAAVVIEAITSFASPSLTGWQTVQRDGRTSSRGASPLPDCPRCARAAPARAADELSAAVALGRAAQQWGGVTSATPAVRRIGVIGGGSAGYLTALGLRAHLPGVEVTLVESPTIPIIGVGEASTPDLVEFLHRELRVDEASLYREVRPTWKLGLDLDWGKPGRGSFRFPFAASWALEAWGADRPDTMSLGAALMAAGKGPVVRDDDGAVRSLLSEMPFAYHLDNQRLVAFLQKLAHERGIGRQLATIASVERGPDGSIAALVTDDARRLSFDLYLDCSGFASLLLGRTLETPWQSYAGSLFNDRALVGGWSHGGRFDPFTRIETMQAGWCWTIPTPEANHSGYVFSSSFLSPEGAERELRAHLPTIGDTRLVRFRTGRFRDAWVHNVIGLGNAYGFVEPLESTSLHLVIHAVGELRRAVSMMGSGDDEPARRLFNERVGAHWDYLRDFLAVHFRFNERVASDYWRTCQREADLGGAARLVDLYRQGAPLSGRADREVLAAQVAHDGLFTLFSWDVLLHHQGVPGRWRLPPARPSYERWATRALPALVARALPHAEALTAYGALLARG